MFKLLITIITISSTDVHTQVIEFENKEDADIAYNKIHSGSLRPHAARYTEKLYLEEE